MGLTEIAECVCGKGRIVGYGSVYRTTPYKHINPLVMCENPKPKTKPTVIKPDIITDGSALEATPINSELL